MLEGVVDLLLAQSDAAAVGPAQDLLPGHRHLLEARRNLLVVQLDAFLLGRILPRCGAKMAWSNAFGPFSKFRVRENKIFGVLAKFTPNQLSLDMENFFKFYYLAFLLG